MCLTHVLNLLTAQGTVLTSACRNAHPLKIIALPWAGILQGTANLRSNHSLHDPGEALGGLHPMPPIVTPEGKGTQRGYNI